MHYIKGPNNIIADTFSRLDWINGFQSLEGKNASLEMPGAFEQGCNIVQDSQMIECFLNLPCLYDPSKNTLNYEYLSKQQVEDEKLQ